MLSKANRFHGLGSLNFVYRRGKQVRTGQIALKYIRNNKRLAYRCAVVVSKKVQKSAVARNRIRRRVYEAVRVEAASITEPYDLVFTIFDEAVATLPATELQADIKTLLEQAGVIGKAKKL